MLRYWLANHFSDFDEVLLKEVTDFIETRLMQNLAQSGQTLLQLIDRQVFFFFSNLFFNFFFSFSWLCVSVCSWCPHRRKQSAPPHHRQPSPLSLLPNRSSHLRAGTPKRFSTWPLWRLLVSSPSLVGHPSLTCLSSPSYALRRTRVLQEDQTARVSQAVVAEEGQAHTGSRYLRHHYSLQSSQQLDYL